MDTVGKGICGQCKLEDMPLYSVDGKLLCFDCAKPDPTIGEAAKGFYDLFFGDDKKAEKS